MHIRLDKISFYVLNILALIGIILILLTSFAYLTWTGFGEQGEVQFASVSAMLYQGYPLYTELDAAGRYSLQHGPIVYLVAGAVMKLFGASYLTAKFVGAVAPILALIISWFWFAKLTTKRNAFLLLGLQSWILLHWHHIFFIRPDSLMLLTMATSMAIVTTTKKKWLLILGLAIPMGIMVNLKIHGIIYFLPVVALVYRQLTWKHRWNIIGITLLVAISPFILPGISLTNYLIWVTQSVHHGFSFKNFIPKIAMILEFSIILFSIGNIYGFNFRTFYKKHEDMFWVLSGAIIITSIIGSKSGSGTNHIMPFVPIFVYLTIMLLNVTQTKGMALPQTTRSKFVRGMSYALLTAMILVTLIGGVSREMSFLKIIYEDNHDSVIILSELRSIEKQYEGNKIALGYGENSYIKYRNFLPYLVFSGNPLLVEVVAIMDMKAAKIPIPPATIKAIEDGMIPVWLIPAGEKPFAMGYKDGEPMFDESFRQSFLHYYQVVEKTPHFDIWMYKK